MRQGPRCNGNYPDQTLIYYLDDGSPLIPYAPAATLHESGLAPNLNEPSQERGLSLKSFIISRLAFAPGAPVSPPPGCVPAPHR